MPFVNHDSDKSKNFSMEFFFTKFQRKNKEFKENSEKLGRHLAT
jgi:hypothetical protein